MALFAIPEDWQLKVKLRDELTPIQEANGIDSSIPVTPTHQEFLDFAAKCTIRSGVRYISFSPLFEYQKAVALLADHYRGLAIVKDRQLGITELLICWMLCRSQYNPAYASATFSITEKDAHKVSQRVKRMPVSISDFKWDIDSLSVRKPSGGGEMNFRPSTENATRGLESIWDLFFDEAGFIPIIDEMYAASSPSQEMVGEDARTFIVSTIPPEGVDSWFWRRISEDNGTIDAEEMLQLARAGGHLNKTSVPLPEIPGLVVWEDLGGWAKVVIGHKAHPIYGANPNFVEDQRLRKKITQEQAEREYNLGLPTSGGSLFNIEKLEEYKRDWVVVAREYGNTLTIWHQPKRNHNYIMGTDPNGKGSNNFVTQVWDITTAPFKLVAEYAEANQASLTRSIEITSDLIERYQPFRATVESNFGGVVIAENLREDNYDIQVDVVVTTARSKQVNTDRIAYELESGSFEYANDWEGVGEAKKFSALHREATSGMDDRVMAWAVTFANIEDIMEELGQPPDWIGKI